MIYLIIVPTILVLIWWFIFYLGEKVSKRYPTSLFAKFWNDYICMGIPDNEDM